MADTPETPTDEQDHAEDFDGDVLGEQPGDHGLPGMNLSAGDPGLYAEVDEPSLAEQWQDASEDDQSTGLRLAETLGDEPSLIDNEKQSVAEAFVPQDGEFSAEEAALHVIDDEAGEDRSLT